MFIVYSFVTAAGCIGIAFREGGVGKAIAHAMAVARLTEDTLTEVRCIGRNLSYEMAQKVFDQAEYTDGRAVWLNGEVLDRLSDKR